MVTINQASKGFHNRKKKNSRILKIFLKSPQRRAVVYQLSIMTPRKPNSAKRKIAKVRLFINNKKIFCKIPGMGHNLHEHSIVMVEAGGAKDLPGVNFTLIRGSLDFDANELFERKKSRSKYGLRTKKNN